MSYGPAPPPNLRSDESKEESKLYGPARPPSTASSSCAPSTSSCLDAESSIGPALPSSSERTMSSRASEVERRSSQMLAQLSGSTSNATRREEWMLALPTVNKEHSLSSLGPRSFRTKTNDAKQDRSWTRAPNDDSEEKEEEKLDDVEEYMRNLQRDEQMEQEAKRLSAKRPQESLVEMHERKKRKKEKKEKKKKKKKSKEEERRPFDRDTDLSVVKKRSAKEMAARGAAMLDSKFSRGAQKFL